MENNIKIKKYWLEIWLINIWKKDLLAKAYGIVDNSYYDSET